MSIIFHKYIPLLLACILPVAGLSAQETAPSVQMTVPLAPQSPVIDGKVTAAEQAGAVSAPMVPVGGLNAQLKYPTQVYVSATISGLYVGFIVEEPIMDALVTNAARDNEAVFNDDSVQVLITPTLDTAADAYYNFAINPRGIKYSNHLITGDVPAGWQAAASKADAGWQAEFFLPLASINAPAELPMWRANFARVRPARADQPEEISAWVNPGISLHNYKRFGYLTVPRFVPPAPTGSTRNTGPLDLVTTTVQQRSIPATTIPAPEAGAPQ